MNGNADDQVDRNIAALLTERVTQHGRGPVDTPSIRLWCSAVDDDNPMYWSDQQRALAPPAMVGTWTQAPPWTPSGPPVRALELHHRLKDALGLPTAVVREVSHAYGVPVRVGDLLTATHRITDVGPLRRSRLGEGRDWQVQVEHTNSDGETAATETWSFHGYSPLPRASDGPGSSPTGDRDTATTENQLPELSLDIDAGRIVKAAAGSGDWTRFHHDPVAARAAGLLDIIFNTPGHLALITRWATTIAPGSRPSGLSLRLRRSVFPGDNLKVGGRIVAETTTSDGWRVLELAVTERVRETTVATGRITLVVDGDRKSGSTVSTPSRDPWALPADRWRAIANSPSSSLT